MSKCKHLRLIPEAHIQGIRIRCIKCDKLIWHKSGMMFDKFLESRRDIFGAMGYTINGHKKYQQPEEPKISDFDLLMLRIDMALDRNDETEFDLLVQELDRVES